MCIWYVGPCSLMFVLHMGINGHVLSEMSGNMLMCNVIGVVRVVKWIVA